jgi:hypothetical protein
MNYQKSLDEFHRLVAHVRDDRIRDLLKVWAMRNIQIYSVETSFDFDAPTEGHSYLEHEKERRMKQLVEGIVKSSHREEQKFWEPEILSGEGLQKLKAVRSTVAVLGRSP